MVSDMRALPSSGGTDGPSVQRGSPGGRPGRTIWASRLVREQFPGTFPRGAPGFRLVHEPRRRARRRRGRRARRTPGAAPRGTTPDRVAAGRARRLLRCPAHRQPARARAARDGRSTSSPPARGCSSSCGWSSSRTCCPTATPCRRGGAAGCSPGWPGSRRSSSGPPATPTGSGRPTTAPTRRWPWCRHRSSPSSGWPAGAHRPPVLRRGVRGARPAAAVLGRDPSPAAVARLGSDQPAAGARARLGGALRPRRQPARHRVAPDLAGAALPVAIGIAILRHQLFDIQLVLSRTLTYGVLVAAVVAFYALLLAVAERLLGRQRRGRRARRRGRRGRGAAGVLTAARRIERWVYGYRSDPAAALRRLGASLESADPLHVVETITASVADALKVDRVWVAAPGAEPAPRPEGPCVSPGPPRRAHRRPGRRGARRPPALAGRHRAAPRPRPPGRGHRAGRPARRRAAGLAVADRHRPRGGAQTAPPRPPRRRRAVPGRDPAQARGGPVAARTPRRATPC